MLPASNSLVLAFPPYFLDMLQGMWDLGSLATDGTCAPYSGSATSQVWDHQGSP